MAELFFQYKKTVYIFDTKQLKLFQIENGELTEIKKQKTLQNVRFKSVEIRENQAYDLARRFAN